MIKPESTLNSNPHMPPTSISEDDCLDVLRRVFKHANYKGKQKEIIKGACEGRDVFVLAPTGMGKSVCFQIPAVAAKSGVTVVVSPLLALMNNQLASLGERGVPVAQLNSETDSDAKKGVEEDLCSEYPTTKLLYVTPERFSNNRFGGILNILYKNNAINRLVVDEAHCISEWGHDFRPQYRKLSRFRQKYPDVPIMALTATATIDVQIDIIRTLGMRDELRAMHPFNRANLFYEVRPVASHHPSTLKNMISDYIKMLHERRGRPSSGIVYCRYKRTCKDVADHLRKAGIQAREYHRDQSSSMLKQTLQQWQKGGRGEGGVDVICATTAFGMGIDKPDVRYIIHYDMPRSFEGYYQETGRAGRDGEPSKCILYYSRQDAIEVRNWVNKDHQERLNSYDQGLTQTEPSQRKPDSLTSLINFAENSTLCRHVAICRYFGEYIEDTEKGRRSLCDQMCDVCASPNKTRLKYDALESISWSSPPSAPNYLAVKDSTIRQQTHPQGQNGKRNLGMTRHLPEGSAAPQSGANKRVKLDPPLKVMVTKPFSSASRLIKPFKTPFKVPLPQAQTEKQAEPADDGVVTGCSDVTNGEWKFAVQHGDNETPGLPEPISKVLSPNARVPILPETAIGLLEPISNKVEEKTRKQAMNDLRRSLYVAFEDTDIQIKPFPCLSSHKDEALALTAQVLENMALSMCATETGYRTRVDCSIDALKSMVEGEGNEEVQEIEETLRQVCRSLCKRGKSESQ